MIAFAEELAKKKSSGTSSFVLRMWRRFPFLMAPSM